VTLANPLGTAAFFDLLRVVDVKLVLNWHQEMSGTGGGDTLYADLAPPRWHADITTVPMEFAEAEGIMALINSRGGGLKTVLLGNSKLPCPSSDPDGSIFGAATPVLGTITDRSHVAFAGFPAGYVLPLGTYFQVIFGTSRYYLGQVCEAKTADGSGNVTATEITPPLPASVSAGDAVTVINPAGKFIIVPNSAYPSAISTVHETITFSAEQTYRA
jgi:hypothetical protein